MRLPRSASTSTTPRFAFSAWNCRSFCQSLPKAAGQDMRCQLLHIIGVLCVLRGSAITISASASASIARGHMPCCQPLPEAVGQGSTSGTHHHCVLRQQRNADSL